MSPEVNKVDQNILSRGDGILTPLITLHPRQPSTYHPSSPAR